MFSKESMLITLIFCLCLGTNVHSDILELSNNSISTFISNTPKKVTAEEFCDKDNELANFPCITKKDHENLWGGHVKFGLAQMLNVWLIDESIFLIGKQELRKALHLPPLPPWTHYNSTDPSDAEIESAPTIEAYFDLKEPKSQKHSLDSFYFFEHQLPPAIEFLDKRIPIVRRFLRCKFENIRPEDTVIDRKTVDRMIKEFYEIIDIKERVHNRMQVLDCLRV